MFFKFNDHVQQRKSGLFKDATNTFLQKNSAVFAFGNRYAPDYYEGIIPDHSQKKLIYWLVGGLIGKVLLLKNALVGDPTQIRCLGYICDNDGKIINTRDHVI